MFEKLDLASLIKEHVVVKEKGYEEEKMIELILAMIIAGGEPLDDMELLASDPAYKKLVKQDRVPSAVSLGRFLKGFHREQKKPEGLLSWVPFENKPLKGLGLVNQSLVKKLVEKSGLKEVTIENDATAIFSQKEDALTTYKGPLGYMPTVGVLAELGLVLADEFRDGNVSPNYNVWDFFWKSVSSLPQTVEKIKTRLDGAYYDHDFIKKLNHWKVNFTITGLKSDELLDSIEGLPKEGWKPFINSQGVPTDREYNELHWVCLSLFRDSHK